MADIKGLYQQCIDEGFIDGKRTSEEAFVDLLKDVKRRGSFYNFVQKRDNTFFSEDQNEFNKNVDNALASLEAPVAPVNPPVVGDEHLKEQQMQAPFVAPDAKEQQEILRQMGQVPTMSQDATRVAPVSYSKTAIDPENGDRRNAFDPVLGDDVVARNMDMAMKREADLPTFDAMWNGTEEHAGDKAIFEGVLDEAKKRMEETAKREYSAPSTGIGQALWSQRVANQQASPDRVLSETEKLLDEKYGQGAPSDKELMHAANMEYNQYAEYKQYVEEQIAQYFVGANIPKDKMDYFVRKVMQGILAFKLGSLATETLQQRQYDQQGMGVYAENNNTLGLDVAAEGVNLVASLPLLAGYGKVGELAVNGAVKLASKGIAAYGAESAAAIGTRAVAATNATKLAFGALSSATTFATMNSVNSAVDQLYSTGSIDPAKVAESAGLGALTGVTLAGFGVLNQGLKRSFVDRMGEGWKSTIGAGATSIMGETAIFTAQSVMEQAMADPYFSVDDINWAETIGQAAGMSMAFKTIGLVKMMPTKRKSESAEAFKARFAKDFTNRLHATDASIHLSQDELDQLREAGYEGNTILDIVKSISKSYAGGKSSEISLYRENSKGESPLQELFSNPKIDTSVKEKIYYTISGQMQPLTMPVYVSGKENVYGKFRVRTYDNAGMVYETRTFQNEAAANRYIDKQHEATRNNLCASLEQLARTKGWAEQFIYATTTAENRLMDNNAGITREQIEALIKKPRTARTPEENALVDEFANYFEAEITKRRGNDAVAAINKRAADALGMSEEDLNNILSKKYKDMNEEEVDAFETYLSILREYVGDNVNVGSKRTLFSGPDESSTEGRASAYVQQIINKDGNVYAVVDKDGNEGYIISGKLVVDKEGNISLGQSDNRVVMRDADGNTKFINTSSIYSAEVASGEQVRADYIAKETAKEKNLQEFHEGDEVRMLTPDGQVVEDGNPSHVVEVTNEGVGIETQNPDGSVGEMIVPHEEAAANLVAEPQKMYLHDNYDNTDFELTKREDGNWEDPKGNAYGQNTIDYMIKNGDWSEGQAPAAPVAPEAPAVAPVEQAAPAPVANPAPVESAQPKYPTTKEGKLDWAQMDVQTAVAAARERFGDDETALAFFETRMAAAQKELDKVSKEKPKSIDEDQFMAELQSINQRKQDAQLAVDAAKVTLDALASKEEKVEKTLQNENNSVSLQPDNSASNGQGTIEQNNTPKQPDGSGMGNGAEPRGLVSGGTSSLQNDAAWLSSQQRGDLPTSQRHREDAVSELLIERAKKNGTFIPRSEWNKFGEKRVGITGESTIFFDDANNRVVKFKDPFAKASMKGSDPIDVLSEVQIHNELFPNSRYELIGYSEDGLGNVRLVLSQNLVSDALRPAEEAEVKNYLENLGFKKVGNYEYVRGNIVVTDVLGDNVLKDKNGELYFIDPIIGIRDQKQFKLEYERGRFVVEAQGIHISPTERRFFDGISRSLDTPIRVREFPSWIPRSARAYNDNAAGEIIVKPDVLNERELCVRSILGHEVTHRIIKLSNAHPELKRAFFDSVRTTIGDELFDREFNRRRKLYDEQFQKASENGHQMVLLSDEDVEEEVCADWAGDMIFTDDKFMKDLIDRTYKYDGSAGMYSYEFWHQMDDMFERFERGIIGDDDVYDIYKNIGKARERWATMYSYIAMKNREKMRPNEAPDQMNSAETDKNSLSFNMVTEPFLEKAIMEYAESKEAKKLGWVKADIQSIVKETRDMLEFAHKMISGDATYDDFAKKNPTMKVDWRDGMMKPVVTWARNNIEYKFDMSSGTFCINNEAIEKMFALPVMADLMLHTADFAEYTSDDYLTLYSTLRDMGFFVSCKGCFDAAARIKMLPSVAQNFARDVNAIITERNADPEAFDAAVRNMKGNKTESGLPAGASTKLDAIRIGVSGDQLTEPINWTQLMSAKGQTKMLSDWGGIFRAWQRTGAGRPKDKLMAEPYAGVIMNQSYTIIAPYGEKTPSFRDIEVNQGTGLRRNSHDEFRVETAIDEIQFMRDAWLKGLRVFKYSKELDDVRLFGNTGAKYNMSGFPAFIKGGVAAGLDANGRYAMAEESIGGREFMYKDENGITHYDGYKGMQEALKYCNKDVSLSTVVFSAPHLIKCLVDTPTPSDPSGIWGSFIPFHSSGATNRALFEQGLGAARANGTGHDFMKEAFEDYDKGVTAFEQVQNDRFGEGWRCVLGKNAGKDVNYGHKIEFVNGTAYRNDAIGVTFYASKNAYKTLGGTEDFKVGGEFYTLDSEGNKTAHPLHVDYNDKVRELGGDYAYKDAADFYIKELRSVGLLPRFDFEVPEDKFLEMCSKVVYEQGPKEGQPIDPHDPKLGWKGDGHGWSPCDSDAYYAMFCDYGMTDPATGKLAPHNIVLEGQREPDALLKALPENYIEVIQNGLARNTNRNAAEDKMVNDAVIEYCRRSIKNKKMDPQTASRILEKHGIKNFSFKFDEGAAPARMEGESILDYAKRLKEWKVANPVKKQSRVVSAEQKAQDDVYAAAAEMAKQDFGSGATSINGNKLPSGFGLVEKIGGFVKGGTNLDMGGGRFDNATEMLAGIGVENLVFDPYNRSTDHNQKVAERVKDEGVDTAICNNCLNVINTAGARSNVILQCAKALKAGGTAYFTIYEGNGSGVGKVSKNDCWQENRKTADYLDEIREHFGKVETKGKLIIASEPKVNGKVSIWNYDASGDNSIKFSFGEETDRSYEKAVEYGDRVEAQRMVDEAAKAAGYTINGMHGTTNKFYVFDRSKSNVENNWGKGFYFTTNDDDVTENYANNDGPDLTGRIELLAEDLEWRDGYEEMSYDDRLEAARKMLSEGEPRVINAYLKMENPVTFNNSDRYRGPKETWFDSDLEVDEDGEEVGEPTGLFWKFLDTFERVYRDMDSWPNDGDFLKVKDQMIETAIEYGGMGASELEEKAREAVAYAEGDEGIIGAEVLRRTFEEMGFDGIIDCNVGQKFGSGRRFGRGMIGVDNSTTHMIVFQPNQIKQADYATYDNDGNLIPLSKRFNEANDDIRYKFDSESIGTPKYREAGHENESMLDFAKRMRDYNKTQDAAPRDLWGDILDIYSAYTANALDAKDVVDSVETYNRSLKKPYPAIQKAVDEFRDWSDVYNNAKVYQKIF